MDGGLRQHAVVLELALAERRSVSGDDDQLGLAGAEALEGGLVAESDCGIRSEVDLQTFEVRRDLPLPLLMTSASLELMLLASLLLFLMAILTVWRGGDPWELGGCRLMDCFAEGLSSQKVLGYRCLWRKKISGAGLKPVGQ